MKQLTLFFLAALTAQAAETFRVFWWQDSRDEKTGEKLSAFYLAPEIVMQVFQADAQGDTKTVEALAPKIPENAKLYIVLLKGESKSYSKDSIRLFDGPKCGTEHQIDSGGIKVDPKTGTVSVSLKLTDNGQVAAFEGNGRFEIVEKLPNKRVQPTAPSDRG
ncbi:MAG: hypothetical protein U1F61_24610 [Opitutaceae bacterium]